MSRLQRSQHVRPDAFKRTLIYSCCAHALLLFFLLFTVATDVLRIDMQPAHEARVICVPAYRVPPVQKVPKKTKKVPEAKQQLEKPQPVKKEVPKKQEEKPATTIEIKKEAAKKVVEEVKKQKQIESPEKTAEKEEEQILYVNKDTYAHMQLARALQDAIALHWQPPPGIPADCSCDIQVTVNKAGKPSQPAVVKKSGWPIYDMAAKQAVLKTTYPPAVRGRTVIVHFSEDFSCAS